MDLSPVCRPPSAVLVSLATLASVAGSLGLDAILVALGTRVIPSIKGYPHFAFADYSKLTVIGVVLACLAWPVVARITSTPRPAFFRMAVLVTIVLWLPDMWLFTRHQAPLAVGVLMAMHLAIALVTYNLIVHVAAVRTQDDDPSGGVEVGETTNGTSAGPPTAGVQEETGLLRSPRLTRKLSITMAIVVGVEFILGIATLVLVPIGRPNGLLPTRERLVYIAHAGVGTFLVVGASVLVVASWHAGRSVRIGAVLGAIGILLGASGGLLAIFHPARMAALALMFLGTVVAGIGYLGPVMESLPSHQP